MRAAAIRVIQRSLYELALRSLRDVAGPPERHEAEARLLAASLWEAIAERRVELCQELGRLEQAGGSE